MACDVFDRKVIGQRTMRQHSKREGNQQELKRCGRFGQRLPTLVVVQGSGKRQDTLNQRHTRSQNQGKVTNFNNHSKLFSII